MNRSFTSLLEYYVVTYVKNEAGQSGETLRSYYTALDQYVLWLADTEKVSATSIDVSHFSREKIQAFLRHLEDDKGVCASTRNLRRAGIVSFLEFASGVCPLYTQAYLDAQSIKVKKSPGTEKSFLTIEEYRSMLECIDISRRNGFGHCLLVCTMYDTAARVSEGVSMNFEDFSFGSENSVLIYGKGAKYRRIYLTASTVRLIKKAADKYGRKTGLLFLNKSGNRITDAGIDCILKKYAVVASKSIPSLKHKIVSPHTLRRSKATHMLLNGASLPVIQRFLGHESITTTEEYLDLGSEAMTRAVQEAKSKLKEHGIGNETAVSDWKDPDVMRRLKMMAK